MWRERVDVSKGWEEEECWLVEDEGCGVCSRLIPTLEWWGTEDEGKEEEEEEGFWDICWSTGGGGGREDILFVKREKASRTESNFDSNCKKRLSTFEEKEEDESEEDDICWEEEDDAESSEWGFIVNKDKTVIKEMTIKRKDERKKKKIKIDLYDLLVNQNKCCFNLFLASTRIRNEDNLKTNQSNHAYPQSD